MTYKSPLFIPVGIFPLHSTETRISCAFLCTSFKLILLSLNLRINSRYIYDLFASVISKNISVKFLCYSLNLQIGCLSTTSVTPPVFLYFKK